jgi:hypothetical protein
MKILSHNYTGNSLAMVYSDETGVQTKFVREGQPNWPLVFALYRDGRYEDIIPFMNVSSAISHKFNGFTVIGGKVFFKGVEVGGYLVDRILFFMQTLPTQSERLIRFAENLFLNPDTVVRDTLYKFLEHKGFTITSDGCFLGYKGVNRDYYSITSGSIEVIRGSVGPTGRILNSVGEIIEVERSQVCNDPNRGCEKGIHIGSWEYADNFKGEDGRMMIVKCNPRNVVSVPSDCNFSKVRVCEYEVIAEEGRKLHPVKDLNFDKVAAHRKHSMRDPKTGKFVQASW